MKDLIERLRDTASKGVSVWGDLQMEAADALEAAQAEIKRHKMHIKHIGNDALRSENAALKAELAARWIPVTERVSEPEVSVLCYGPNTIQPDLPWITFVDWCGSKPDFGCGVTHWMPLPAAPGAKP